MSVSGDSRATFEKAFTLTGHGFYNYMVLLACCVITDAVAVDVFGFGIVVAASRCDLQIQIWQTGLLVSIPFAGVIVSFLWGYYADTRGRRKALLLTMWFGFIFTALSSLSVSWEMLLVLKLLGSSCTTAGFSLTMTYLGESVSEKYRNQYFSIMQSSNLCSETVSFLMAYLVLMLDFNVPISVLSITFRPWRLLVLVMAAPIAIGAVLLVYLHESPMFLVENRETDKALEILGKIYKSNRGKEDFPVKELEVSKSEHQPKVSFWQTTKPAFKPPLLWRTLQLFFLFVVTSCTNNVFLMWYPTMVNSFFESMSKGILEKTFCERAVGTIDDVATANSTFSLEPEICSDKLSQNMIYSGILYGVFFTFLNLGISFVAAWRRTVTVSVLVVSSLSCILLIFLREAISSFIMFFLVQCTGTTVGVIGLYFTDLYSTGCRGFVTSMAFMVARIFSFAGVNIIGITIMSHCTATISCWTVLVVCGAVAALLLPSSKKSRIDTR